MELVLDFLYQTHILHLWYYLSSFILILSTIVFIHEFGHYGVAKLCGVKIEAFSIGFGPEIIGWNDKSGTRWKFSLVPMGGYVKMFGDVNPASAPDNDMLQTLTPEQEKVTFHGKKLWQKSLIVLAGPLANFLLAIVILTSFILIYGKPQTQPVAEEILADSSAEAIGMQPGDVIIELNGEKVADFSDIQNIVSINTGTPLPITYRRGEKAITAVITPKIMESTDMFGNKIERAFIGIKASANAYSTEKVGFFSAVSIATAQTYQIAATNLKAIGQIVTGSRSIKDLGGPVKIAKYSGQATQMGLNTVLWFMVVVSVGLGLINLFPIPVLDGGHLMYYVIEAIQGKPLAQKYQEYGLKAGMAVVIGLAVVVTFNDVVQLVKS